MKKQKPRPAGTGTDAQREISSSTRGHGQPVLAKDRQEPTAEPFSARELRDIGEQISASWFRPPEESRLTLLEIDPWRVHAYWNLAEAEVAAARASLADDAEDARLVLRFTDLSPGTGDTGPPHERFDIKVQGMRNNWYIDLWRDAKHYSAELGLRAADGAFVVLARSNEVATPRAGPSPELDFRQLEVRSPRPASSRQMRSSASSSDTLLRDLFPKRLAPEEDYPLVLAEASGARLEEPAFPSLEAEDGAVAAATDLAAPLPAFDAERSPAVAQADAVRAEPPIAVAQESGEPATPAVSAGAATSVPSVGPTRPAAGIETEFPQEESGEPATPAVSAGAATGESSAGAARPAVGIETEFPPIEMVEIEPYRALARTLQDRILAELDTRLPPVAEETVSPTDVDLTPQPLPIPSAVEPAGEATPEPVTEATTMARNDSTRDSGIDTGVVAKSSLPEQAPNAAVAEPAPAISLEMVLGGSTFSPGHGASPVVASAEILIRGQCPVDRTLLLFGEPVTIQDDGSFTLRLPLEQGPELVALLRQLHSRRGDREHG